ncbi:hypothetical protein IWZ01DRAFT_71919 [Phyllosticta capitalensis]
MVDLPDLRPARVQGMTLNIEWALLAPLTGLLPSAYIIQSLSCLVSTSTNRLRSSPSPSQPFPKMADRLSSSTRRRTQRCSSPNSTCITPPASPPPALPLSPTSTAEYWDHALEKHLKERRTRRASKSSSRNSRHHNRAALDMISSHEEEDLTVPSSASSFDFGFPERDRADSAHETEGVVESVKSKDVRRQTSSQTLRVFPANNKRASGRRREGQTLASPAPLSPTQRPKTSADKSSSSSPQRRKCPPRPPRPDDDILFIPSLCSAAQSSASRSNRSSASRSRRFTESIPENAIAESSTPPRSSHSSPSITVSASAAPRSFPSSYTSPSSADPSPPMTPVHTAHFALHQTVSVWDSDDSDDEGLLRYVRRTLHASKSSMSGRTSSERQKSRERANTNATHSEKSSDDDVSGSDAKTRSSRRRRRRSTMREAVIRVFGCA